MSCCLVIVLGIIALCAMMFQFVVGLVVFDIVFFLLFLGSIGKADELRKTKPSKMICSNCNSRNVKLSTRKSGKTISGSHYGHNVFGNTTINYERIAECKDCGFVWNYTTQEDIDNEYKKMINLRNIFGAVFIILTIFTLWIFL